MQSCELSLILFRSKHILFRFSSVNVGFVRGQHSDCTKIRCVARSYSLRLSNMLEIGCSKQGVFEVRVEGRCVYGCSLSSTGTTRVPQHLVVCRQVCTLDHSDFCNSRIAGSLGQWRGLASAKCVAHCPRHQLDPEGVLHDQSLINSLCQALNRDKSHVLHSIVCMEALIGLADCPCNAVSPLHLLQVCNHAHAFNTRTSYKILEDDPIQAAVAIYWISMTNRKRVSKRDGNLGQKLRDLVDCTGHVQGLSENMQHMVFRRSICDCGHAGCPVLAALDIVIDGLQRALQESRPHLNQGIKAATGDVRWQNMLVDWTMMMWHRTHLLLSSIGKPVMAAMQEEIAAELIAEEQASKTAKKVNKRQSVREASNEPLRDTRHAIFVCPLTKVR